MEERKDEEQESQEQPEQAQEQQEQQAEQPQKQPTPPEEPKLHLEPKQKSELPKKLIGQVKRIGAVGQKQEKLKTFINECKRVLRVTKKPDKQEFVTIVKISAIGMAVIGVVGFLIHFAKELLF